MEVIKSIYYSTEISLSWRYESITELDKVSVSLLSFFNTIKSSGYYTYHLYVCTYVQEWAKDLPLAPRPIMIYIRTTYFYIPKLGNLCTRIYLFRMVFAGFCSGEVKCFLWGTNWMFTYFSEDIRPLKGLFISILNRLNDIYMYCIVQEWNIETRRMFWAARVC
jgi:hypothetical protein